MGKGRFFGSVLLVAVIALAAAWSGGCGQSNDQGISFRALGFSETGVCASLSEDGSVPADRDNDGTADGGFLDLQNNMAQGLQVERVDLSYRVSGASINIPGDQFPLSARLGPSSNQEPLNPPSGSFQVLIVSPQTMEFLNNNRSRLPEPPFTLVAQAVAVAVSDGGDVFTTNRVAYPVIMVDGQCVPTPTPEPTAEPAP